MIALALLAAAAQPPVGHRSEMARLIAAEVHLARRPTVAVLLAPGSWTEAAHQQILLDAARAGLRRRAAELTEQMTASERRARAEAGANRIALPANETQGLIAAAADSDAPYRLPATGRIVTRFGAIDDQGVRARGITMVPDPGASLVAPAAGRVAYAGPYRGYGDVLIVEHGHGWTSLVAGGNLSGVETGARLRAGQPIGTTGGPLLVELRRNGRPVDVMGMAHRLGGSAISQQGMVR